MKYDTNMGTKGNIIELISHLNKLAAEVEKLKEAKASPKPKSNVRKVTEVADSD